MSFQVPATTANAGAGFTFGATGGGDAGNAKGFAFGGVGSTTTTTAAAPGFSFGATAVTSTPSALPSFNIGTAPPSVAATTAAAPIAKTTAAPALSLTAATSAAPATAAGGGFANLSTATKTTDSSTVSNASQLSYNQLEEYINKWTLELEEQEKVFTDQATQINAWDKILISNNQKILELNDAVQKVKSDQQTLEQELEFIATQHKELEESIVPLQKEFMKIPQVDVERSQTYLLVENLDTQLKQMSEDLKEIIDNLNEANKGQDNTDPIIQIGKILNAHMSSLQWIESSSSNISNKLEDITKMHESFKRESERSFRSAYYN